MEGQGDEGSLAPSGPEIRSEFLLRPGCFLHHLSDHLNFRTNQRLPAKQGHQGRERPFFSEQIFFHLYLVAPAVASSSRSFSLDRSSRFFDYSPASWNRSTSPIFITPSGAKGYSRLARPSPRSSMNSTNRSKGPSRRRFWTRAQGTSATGQQRDSSHELALEPLNNPNR